MHEAGVLKALFPEWEGIECLVVRDLYHRYTVDEHTLVALQTLAELAGTRDPLRQRLAALLQEASNPALLLFALLWHDIGKAGRAAPHPGESARLADAALARLQAPAEARRVVRFLIERHLELHDVMLRRDLDEPATVRLLAERVETVERLRELTLLTYADISAANPDAMTRWRLEQLWRLYLVTHHELTRELDAERIQGSPAVAPELAAFPEGLPVRYLRTHSEEEIREHFQLYQLAEDRGVAIDVRKRNGTCSLAVITHDRPFLLASIAGVLAGFGMNILKAEAFGNRRGIILDTFVFEDPSRTFSLNPTEVDRFRLTLERVILGKADVTQWLRGRPRPARPSRSLRIKPSVSFDSEASASATLIEVVAQDRPGLLYDLASALSSAGCNIEVVLLDTEAHKALDVFYVTAGGDKLTSGQQAALRERLLKVCEA
jgi:[protein-PII] uridylyltransferase